MGKLKYQYMIQKKIRLLQDEMNLGRDRKHQTLQRLLINYEIKWEK